MKKKPEQPIIEFRTQSEWRDWLLDNHDNSDGIWMRLYKKKSGIPSIEIGQALDEALCFGWIDGQRKTYDEQSYLQKYTPRRKRSIWSKINTGKIEALSKEGKMHPAGLLEVEKAKADGRWAKAYDSPANMQVPDDFVEAISKFPEAMDFYNSLNKTNRYAIAFRLQTAKKQETRTKRMAAMIEMMKNGEKFH